MATVEELDPIRQAAIDGAGIVANKRDDVLALIAAIDERRDLAGKIGGVAWDVIDAIRMGTKAAPKGEKTIVHHERLHLLQLFDALDKLEAAVKPAPPPEDPAATSGG